MEMRYHLIFQDIDSDFMVFEPEVNISLIDITSFRPVFELRTFCQYEDCIEEMILAQYPGQVKIYRPKKDQSKEQAAIPRPL
jgi:hypothetical protein